jgi:antitoxin (DNA-binding transcriptional repressor) of toxin-antitoxin stability system
MITTGVRELKTHLSGYLRRVEQGERILVTDRGRVVAELNPPGNRTTHDTPQVRYQQLVAQGVIRPAVAPQDRTWLDWPGLALPPGTAQALIDADRDD